MLTAVFRRGYSDQAGAPHIVDDGLVRMAFTDWDVLVRGRMKHDVGPAFTEGAAHTVRFRNVAEPEVELYVLELTSKILSDFGQEVFSVIHTYQTCWSVIRDLAA